MLRDSEAVPRQAARARRRTSAAAPTAELPHARAQHFHSTAVKESGNPATSGRPRPCDPSWSSPSALSEGAIADAVVGTARCAEVGEVREGSFGAERNVALGNRRLNKVLLAPVDTKQLRKTHRAALDAVAEVRGSPIEFLDELAAVRERGYGTPATR
jgi:hypothetical protein